MDFHHRARESREQRASLQFSLFLTSNSKPRNILSAFYKVGNRGGTSTNFKWLTCYWWTSIAIWNKVYFLWKPRFWVGAHAPAPCVLGQPLVVLAHVEQLTRLDNVANAWGSILPALVDWESTVCLGLKQFYPLETTEWVGALVCSAYKCFLTDIAVWKEL